jgi:superfamily I DNA/RNA helicase
LSTWLIPRNELTPEQLCAVELSLHEHRVILGAPGSGKTQILLHRARYLCDSFHVAEDRFHIFVFTNVLKDYIRSALQLLHLPESCVTTLDHWCTEFYREHIGRTLPWNRVEKIPDFAAIRRAILTTLRESRDTVASLDGVRATRHGNLSKHALFEFVLVDEGQDLDEEVFELLKTMATHVTVCMDHKQQIYERGSNERQILARLGLKKRHVSLLEAFRCCPYVHQLAAQLVEDPEEAKEYLHQAQTVQGERDMPLLYRAADFEDEKRRLIEMLRVRLAMGEKIAILLPQRRQVYGFAQGLREAGLEVETPKDCDFSTDLPKILPFPSAKGLTFDTVLMPRLVPSAFVKLHASRIDRLLFVGITRATKWVYMSTAGNSSFSSLEKLAAGASKGCLTVQYPRQAGLRRGEKDEASTASPEEALTDLL